MSFKKLPDDILEEIIGCYNLFIKDDSVSSPSLGGKKACLKQLLKREDFLPKHLQEAVDSRKGSFVSKREYLFEHFDFALEFSRYVD